jgi:hypothetical protein
LSSIDRTFKTNKVKVIDILDEKIEGFQEQIQALELAICRAKTECACSLNELQEQHTTDRAEAQSITNRLEDH